MLLLLLLHPLLLLRPVAKAVKGRRRLEDEVVRSTLFKDTWVVPPALRKFSSLSSAVVCISTAPD